MYSIVLVCSRHEKDVLIADLWESGTAGVTEADVPGGLTELRAFFEDSTDAAPMLGRFSPYAPELHQEEEADWRDEMETGWPVLEVGRRFFVVPAWSRGEPPAGRFRLVVHPGMAYGTGIHETTQLSLEALEEHFRPGERLLDLGCGSGILCDAADLLGAGMIAGCDIDHEAVAIAQSTVNARSALFTGSVRAVRTESLDFVVANINAETIVNLAGEIKRALRPGGRAAVSGFPHRGVERVRATMRSNGFSEIAIAEKGEWTCLVMQVFSRAQDEALADPAVNSESTPSGDEEIDALDCFRAGRGPLLGNVRPRFA